MLPAVLKLPASSPSSARRITGIMALLVLLALLALPWADLAIYPVDPWAELARIGQGIILPYWNSPWVLLESLAQTVAFALLAVALAAPLGMLLAMVFHWTAVRLLCAAVRSVHELFWGLLFMQVYGLSATTGLLAILVPYTGVFAKVFAETIDLQDRDAYRSLPRVNRLIGWAYTRIPQTLPALLSYTRYRFECALRSSAILGFIGLPTLGFHLETAFKQGQYAEAGALLWAFLMLLASIRLWLRPALLPLYLIAAVWLLPETIGFTNSNYFWQFVSQDIWPTALRQGDWAATLDWYWRMFSQQAWPGLVQTLLLTQLALVLTLLVILLIYPFASRALVNQPLYGLGRFALLVMRSTPEMILAFVLLLLFGPSGLPAVIALAIHNGGLIAFLVANNSNSEQAIHGRRPDDPAGLLRYTYVETPRQLPSMLAWLFYRWEVMLRESAIMGILGITTLGFFIDSAFEEIRYDRAFFLILITAGLNIIVDACSRRLRQLALVQPGQANQGRH